MKQVLLIRHAKSSWDDPSVSDFERPLNERGKKDAPVMAQRLSDKNIRIDVFYCQSCKKSQKGQQKFLLKVFKKNKDEIIFKDCTCMEQHQKCFMK